MFSPRSTFSGLSNAVEKGEKDKEKREKERAFSADFSSRCELWPTTPRTLYEPGLTCT